MSALTCLAPVAATFGILQNNWSFALNCGIGIINTRGKTETLDPNYGVFCGACLPAFKATFKNVVTPDYHISTCTAISHCESSSWFNYCSQCEPNYSYEY